MKSSSQQSTESAPGVYTSPSLKAMYSLWMKMREQFGLKPSPAATAAPPLDGWPKQTETFWDLCADDRTEQLFDYVGRASGIATASAYVINKPLNPVSWTKPGQIIYVDKAAPPVPYPTSPLSVTDPKY